MVRNPEEVLEQTYSMAAGKYAKTWYQIFWLGIMAGAYIAIGGFLSLLVGKTPVRSKRTYHKNNK